METARFAAGRCGDLLLSVPIAMLAPGPHLLTVTVTRGAANAGQEVRFNVAGRNGGTADGPNGTSSRRWPRGRRSVEWLAQP